MQVLPQDPGFLPHTWESWVRIQLDPWLPPDPAPSIVGAGGMKPQKGDLCVCLGRNKNKYISPWISFWLERVSPDRETLPQLWFIFKPVVLQRKRRLECMLFALGNIFLCSIDSLYSKSFAGRVNHLISLWKGKKREKNQNSYNCLWNNMELQVEKWDTNDALQALWRGCPDSRQWVPALSFQHDIFSTGFDSDLYPAWPLSYWKSTMPVLG